LLVRGRERRCEGGRSDAWKMNGEIGEIWDVERGVLEA
jgi:hypothetical protein